MDMATQKHTWGRRLAALLTQKGWTAHELSERIIAQFPTDTVSGKVRDGKRLKSSIEGWKTGRVAQPRGSMMDDLATIFSVSKNWLSDGTEPQASKLVEFSKLPVAERGGATILSNAELFGGRLDLPIFGTAEGGQGALIVSDGAVDYGARPTMLLRVQDGYGMIVTGDSMIPEHKPGSIALVNPHLPPRVGDSCIFRSHKDGTTLAMIKEYRGQTEKHWKVRQHHPPKEFLLDKRDWQTVHRTVGNHFP
jgi:phage repressor protein C with HTH and peptisase S24 domain